MAQEQLNKEISEKELQQFGTAYVQVQTLNQQAQQEMAAGIQSKGMEVEKFVEIQQALQENKTSNASPEEMAQFESAIQVLEQVQVTANKKMQESIINTGLTIEQYQEIGGHIQNSPELQQKLQTLLQG